MYNARFHEPTAPRHRNGALQRHKNSLCELNEFLVNEVFTGEITKDQAKMYKTIVMFQGSADLRNLAVYDRLDQLKGRVAQLEEAGETGRNLRPNYCRKSGFNPHAPFERAPDGNWRPMGPREQNHRFMRENRLRNQNRPQLSQNMKKRMRGKGRWTKTQKAERRELVAKVLANATRKATDQQKVTGLR